MLTDKRQFVKYVCLISSLYMYVIAVNDYYYLVSNIKDSVVDLESVSEVPHREMLWVKLYSV